MSDTNHFTPWVGSDPINATTLNSKMAELSGAITTNEGRLVTDTTDPGASDDSYEVGTVWVNTAKDRAWRCVDNTASSAVWVFSGGRVACIATRTSNYSLAHNTTTAVPLDGETLDTDAMHDTVTNNTRITVPFDGLYQLNGLITYASNSSNVRDIRYRVNGAATNYGWNRINASTVGDTPITNSTLLNLSASDYVELISFQNSGSALDVRSNVELQLILIAGEIS